MASQSARVESQWTTPGQYQRSKEKVPQEAIAEILSAVDLFELLRESSVHVKVADGSIVGNANCPFHIGGDDRRTLLVEKQRFECSVCGFRGSPLGWLMYHDGLGFYESLEHLSLKTGVFNQARPTVEDLESDRLFKHEHLRRASSAYQRSLAEHPSSLEYLEKRGISRQSIERFRIGWSSDSAGELLDGNMRNQRSLWQVGILFRQNDGKYRPRFRNRIMFPIRSEHGDTLGFGAREITESNNATRKYINSPSSPLFNKSRVLYGLYEALPAIREKDRIIIFEGYMDVISASQAAVQNVVATLGTSVTIQHIQIALSFASHVTFCLDADSAGKSKTIPALRNALKVVEDHQHVDVLTLPPGMDPDDYFKNHGADDFYAIECMPIEDGLFMEFDNLDHRSLGEMSRFAHCAADYVVESQSAELAAKIQKYAESILSISLAEEVERAKGRAASKRR